MKRIFVVMAVLVAVTLIGIGVASATIVGSKHDLSSTSAATTHATTTTLSACQFCHTPHLGSNTVVTGAPLWNRAISAAGSYNAGDGTTQYQVYGAATAGVAGTTLSNTAVNEPGPNSKTCLSCHDGVLSIGDVLVGTDATAFVGNTVSATDGRLSTSAITNLGTDLNQEHPVGFTVDVAKAGLDTLANMVTDGAKFYGASSNRMECATCHDPHMTDAGKQPFLRMVKASMCTDCHITK